jgi:hypothetical protein
MRAFLFVFLLLNATACVPRIRTPKGTDPTAVPSCSPSPIPSPSFTPMALNSMWTPEWNFILGYWRMDGDFTDSSGRGNNGTASGGTSFSSSIYYVVDTQSAQFSNGLVDVGSLLTPSYTKMAWIYVTDGSVNDNIISGSDSNGQHAFWLSGCSPLHLSGGHNSNWGTVCDPDPVSLQTWYHVAITYDSTTESMNLYKNGLLVDSALNVVDYINGNNVEFASYNQGNFFAGNLNELAIWSVALTQAEVVTIYQNQK